MGGTPEIINLKAICTIFSISVDELIDDTKNIEPIQYCKAEAISESSTLKYEGKYWDVDLEGWNDGVCNVLIIGEDKDYLFYKRAVREKEVVGLIGKRYITEVKESKLSNVIKNNIAKIDRTYFCGKHVFIELACKEGLIKGFFDFRNDDYLDVIVDSFSETKVKLKFGREIEIGVITKIEEL